MLNNEELDKKEFNKIKYDFIIHSLSGNISLLEIVKKKVFLEEFSAVNSLFIKNVINYNLFNYFDIDPNILSVVIWFQLSKVISASWNF